MQQANTPEAEVRPPKRRGPPRRGRPWTVPSGLRARRRQETEGGLSHIPISPPGHRYSRQVVPCGAGKSSRPVACRGSRVSVVRAKSGDAPPTIVMSPVDVGGYRELFQAPYFGLKILLGESTHTAGKAARAGRGRAARTGPNCRRSGRNAPLQVAPTRTGVYSPRPRRTITMCTPADSGLHTVGLEYSS